jgi:EAL and modified HD-GYP domain-containing signal transduction protein
MLDVAILGRVALGYSPFLDRKRSVMATRLTVFPIKGASSLDAGQLLHAVGGVWPADGGQVSLNVSSESLLQDLISAQPSANIMVEIPSFMAVDPANVAGLTALRMHGNKLLLKGRPAEQLPKELLPCFEYSLIDLADDRRVGRVDPPPGVARSIPVVQSGVSSVAEMDDSFKRGAVAVLGWPIDDLVVRSEQAGRSSSKTDMAVIVELIQRLDNGEAIEKLEATLKRDPSLAFKLMRYLNSPGFGLNVEISSFRHAIMMLGYARLKRWLALLLATASQDVNLKPVMFAAVRRGLFMEELVRANGDEEMRNEMFICGVFSLLDRMFGQPFLELLDSIPVPERVYQTLVNKTGPYVPYFAVVRAAENSMVHDYEAAADAVMMSVSEVNRAQLRALTAAAQLE